MTKIGGESGMPPIPPEGGADETKKAKGKKLNKKVKETGKEVFRQLVGEKGGTKDISRSHRGRGEIGKLKEKGKGNIPKDSKIPGEPQISGQQRVKSETVEKMVEGIKTEVDAKVKEIKEKVDEDVEKIKNEVDGIMKDILDSTK